MKRRRPAVTLFAAPLILIACGRSDSPAPPSAAASGPGTAAPAGEALLPAAADLFASHPGPIGPGPASRVDQAIRAIDPREATRRARVVAVVNGEPVTIRDLELRLEETHREAEASERTAFSLDRLMFRMVNDVLLAQEARTLGMDHDEKTRAQVDRFRGEEMLRELEKHEILSHAKVSDAEVRSAFAEQYRRVNLRVITTDGRDDAAAILERVRAGADMAVLAKERSRDPYAARGGSVSGLPLRDLAAEVAALARSLQPGQTGGPVMTDLGWSVIRLEGLEPADPKAFKGAEPILRDLVTMNRVAARRAALAARLEAKFPVTLDEAVRRPIVPKRLPDGRLAPEVGDRDAVVARIGRVTTITAGDYGDALLLRWSGMRSEEAARASMPIVLKSLVDRALLLAEAGSLGYADRPEVRGRTRDHETRILVQRYLEEVLGKSIPIDRDELRTYYDDHRGEFPKPPRLRVGQVTLATRTEADEAAGLLRRGADLAWLARQRSIDRLADAGGDRGTLVPRPGVDEANDRLLTARAGDVLGPFGVPGNFTVLKVLARDEQGFYSFEEVSGNVRSAVFSEKFRKVLDEVVTKLRTRARVEIRRDVLASLEVSGMMENGPARAATPHADVH